MKLDDKNSKLCTFNTPYGRYRYVRLPFGVYPAAEIFQRRMIELLEDLEGVQVVACDILIYGSTAEEHDLRHPRVLSILQQKNIKLNPDKCKFKWRELTCLGLVLTSGGLRPDPEKVRAMKDIRKPSNVEDLRIFLGIVKYLAKFIKNMSDVTAPLRVLLEKTAVWHWFEEQEKAWQEIKKILCEAPVLAYYDLRKVLVLSVDASSRCLRATLLQEGRPVAYGSKALTKTECNYSQIEKELLAIVRSCGKLRDYTIGMQVKLESDHKPLQSMFKKAIDDTPPRLKHMLMQLQRYDLGVEYKKGAELFIVMLSAEYSSKKPTPPVDGPLDVHHVMQQTPVSQDKFQKFKDETASDHELAIVKGVVLDGWPDDIGDCHQKGVFTGHQEKISQWYMELYLKVLE